MRFSHSYLTKGKLRDKALLIIIVAAIAGVGTYLLVGSKAAGPVASITAGQGTLSGCAAAQTDATASGGNKVVFGGSGCNNGGGGGAACSSGETFSPGANLASAIIAAPDGAVICLNSGNYANFFVNGATHKSYVTVQPAPGADPVLSGGGRLADTSFLKFQGLKITAELDIADGSSGASHDIQFINDDISGDSGPRIAPYQNNIITNLTFEGNYIHDIEAPGISYDPATQTCSGSASTNGQAITLGGADNVVIKNNIFKSAAWHYIQGGGSGPGGVLVDHNLFTGPQPANTLNCAHMNVWQIFGGGSNDTFSNNVVVASTAQGTAPVASNSLMFENGPAGSVCTTTMDHTFVNNNLFVDENGSFEFQLMTSTDLTVTNNTIVGSAYGTIVARSDICGNSTNVTETNNIVTNNTNGSFNFGFGGCTVSAAAATLPTFPAQCLTDYNVSQDKTAGTLPGTTHFVANWTPSWRNTTWAPGGFAPGGHSAPPAGYYQPSGLPFSAGYQGSIGP